MATRYIRNVWGAIRFHRLDGTNNQIALQGAEAVSMFRYSQSPLTAMPEMKNAPMRIIWSIATRLNANHRTPFIR